jgi:hypothetical protein
MNYSTTYNFYLYHLNIFLIKKYFTKFVDYFLIIIKLYTILQNKISDGYWLVLLSPFVFLSWIFSTIITIIYIILSIPGIAILIILLSISQFWGIFFELPANFINKKTTLNINNFNYNSKNNWTHATTGILSLSYAISIIGIINNTWLPTYISGGIGFFIILLILCANIEKYD